MLALFTGFLLGIFFNIKADRLIRFCVRKCRDYILSHLDDEKSENMGFGAVMTIGFCTAAFALTAVLMWVLRYTSNAAAFIFETLMFAAVLNISSVTKDGITALNGETDEKKINSVCAKIADTVNDSVIVPVVYMGLGGTALAVLYRTAVIAAEELRFAQNGNFGKFAVRLYDILNFIPRRLSVVLAFAVCRAVRYDYENAQTLFWKNKTKNGYCDSMMSAIYAGIFGLDFPENTPNFGECMNGRTVETDRRAKKEDLKKILKFMYLHSSAALLVSLALRFILA